ncbi:hypothetical protein PTTG_07507 [Puccinia triticina 1-1 BBBD Race 1]|uniref:Uncharacterized protein n=1 Tax=Puccinia triticina (isolate 1-1 / race 1 (BBBD)) TaxID=630390 RepID=A0A180GBR9_PUCT1|nr:hypothetical protein PTTG_07507 [Puccinia triticina 1-1 BBBD Race 1]
MKLISFYKCTNYNLSTQNEVLHPYFKDGYFKLAKWPNSWIDEAVELTREMEDTCYRPNEPTSATITVNKGPPKKPTGVLAGLEAAAVASLVDSLSDPINIWLSGGLVLENRAPVNGLNWWSDQKHRGNTHHGLLQMAIDVMSCPGESI